MSYKLNIDDVQMLLVKEYGLSDKKADDLLRSFFAIIIKALEEEHYVKIKGLGIFKLIDVEPRRSVDVNTGESIEIPTHKKVSYTPDTALKELINKPFAHFETVELNDGVVLGDVMIQGEAVEALLEKKSETLEDNRLSNNESCEDEIGIMTEKNGEVFEEIRCGTDGDVMSEEELEELKRMIKEGEGQKLVMTKLVLMLIGLFIIGGLIYWMCSRM